MAFSEMQVLNMNRAVLRKIYEGYEDMLLDDQACDHSVEERGGNNVWTGEMTRYFFDLSGMLREAYSITHWPYYYSAQALRLEGLCREALTDDRLALCLSLYETMICMYDARGRLTRVCWGADTFNRSSEGSQGPGVYFYREDRSYPEEDLVESRISHICVDGKAQTVEAIPGRTESKTYIHTAGAALVRKVLCGNMALEKAIREEEYDLDFAMAYHALSGVNAIEGHCTLGYQWIAAEISDVHWVNLRQSRLPSG